MNYETWRISYQSSEQAARAAFEAWQESSASVELLSSVANVAALACIDLDANLSCAYKEWMDGAIARGSYEHTLTRHGALHAALFKAGFTEKHELFEFPVKPKAG